MTDSLRSVSSVSYPTNETFKLINYNRYSWDCPTLFIGRRNVAIPNILTLAKFSSGMEQGHVKWTKYLHYCRLLVYLFRAINVYRLVPG